MTREKNPFIDLFDELAGYVGDAEGNPATGINKLHKQAQELVKHIEAACAEDLWSSRTPPFPRAWMRDIPIVEKSRISDVLNALFFYGGLFAPSEVLHDGRHLYAAFVTDADFYARILPTIAGRPMAKITLQKYIAALCKIGALKRIGSTGDYANQPVYAVAYYSDFEWNNKKVKKPLLTQKLEAGLRGIKQIY